MLSTEAEYIYPPILYPVTSIL